MKKLIYLLVLAIYGVAIYSFFSTPTAASRAGQADSGDLWITSAIHSVMEKDSRLSPNQIEVASLKGIVKLDGRALTEDEKGLAEEIAMQIPGVKGIENDIEVLPAIDSDSELQDQTRTELIENPLLHIRELDVEARNGVVTLNGVVSQSRDKHLAGRFVAGLPNVHAVINRIETLGLDRNKMTEL
jgi:osmotically-inducible protein OsmY